MIYQKHKCGHGLCTLWIVTGHISGYYGGEPVSAYSTPATPWRWFFILSALTALIQISLILYRRINSKRLTTLQKLVVTLSDNLVNAKMEWKTFFLSCMLIACIGVAGQLIWKRKEVDYKSEVLPSGLVTYTVGLLFFQVRPFAINPALRYISR